MKLDNPKDLDDMKKIAAVVDRAIVLCDKCTPVADPQSDRGGKVRETAVGVLVAVRAVLEAVIEEGGKR